MHVSIDVYNSIRSLRPCIIITFFIFINIIITSNSVLLDKHKEIIADLPKAKDFNKYLTALEKTVDFCVRHKIYVNLNLEFGLFLINVNIKHILRDKRQSLPTKLRFRMEQILMKNGVLEDYFHYMVRKINNTAQNEADIKISRLFYNDSFWPSSLYKFNTYLLEHTKIYTPEELERIYGKWEIYESNVYNFNKYTPSPNESDMCMAYLENNPPVVNIRAPIICRTPDNCKQAVNAGSEFGYALTHRVLYMIIARFARGCSVFSVKEDKYKVDKYCMRSFNEAQYIASNGFKIPDLILEQMALCGLYGHAQFYRSSWIDKFLTMQTSEGCFTEDDGGFSITGVFNDYMREGQNDKWSISSPDRGVMEGRCNGHMTAVAAATLAAAMRYIMETYY